MFFIGSLLSWVSCGFWVVQLHQTITISLFDLYVSVENDVSLLIKANGKAWFICYKAKEVFPQGYGLCVHEYLLSNINAGK